MLEELNGDFLQWLRGFYYVATTGSVRRAAGHMRRNPSTISYQLRCLEENLNVVLFDRYKKSLRITLEGKKLLDWTISTFETLKDMRSEVGNLRGDLHGRVSIAATLPISALAVSPISAFTRRHPRVRLSIERGLAQDVFSAVLESQVDFGLLPVIHKPDEDCFEVLFKARPLLVAHKDNPWKIPAIPDLADLARLPYVSFTCRDGGDGLCEHIAAAGMGDFVQKNSVIQINNYHLMMRYVLHRLGVAIMDELCFQGSNFGAEWEGLYTIPLDHLLPNRLYGILVRRGKRLSPQAEALRLDLRERFQYLSSLDAKSIWLDSRNHEKKGRTRPAPEVGKKGASKASGA